MLFHEIYSAYYRAMDALVAAAADGTLDERQATAIIGEVAFAESTLAMLPAIKNEDWQVLRRDFTTPLSGQAVQPLSTLQKRWLKAISLDPRFGLFCDGLPQLAEVEPLYSPDDIRLFDQFADGDPYTDSGYIARFRTILAALRLGQRLQLTYTGGKGQQFCHGCTPKRLEYSHKDDKFRLIAAGSQGLAVINLARIASCELLQESAITQPLQRQKHTVTLLLNDQRKTLERAMFHFANLEKETVALGERQYRLTLSYSPDDETEILIRILSFGPMVRVVEPARFITLIKERLARQKSLRTLD